MDTLKQILDKGFKFIVALNVSPLLFMVLFSWAFQLGILEHAGHLTSLRYMLLLLIYGCVVLLMQYFIINKIEPYFQHVNVYNGFIASLFGINLLGFYLSSYDKYLNELLIWQFIIIVIIAGMFYATIKYSERWVFVIVFSLAYLVFFATATLGDTNMIDKIMGNAKTVSLQMPVSLPDNYIQQDFVKRTVL